MTRHQSLMATRMALEDMVDACADIDAAGYWSVECWGGATYDACIRFLNEDPWERLRTFRELMPNSRLQMLLRGQNLLGYRHYEDGVVNRFVEKSAENGMDVYRVFDALNDVRNVREAIAAVRRVDKHAQGTICYTESPLHTVEGYVQMARDLMDLGCDSLCIKDMAALLKPQPAYDIVKAIKDDLGAETRIHVHCHATTGVTLVSLMKAIEAGADVVDTSISSLSLGPGHNPTESLVEMLRGTPYSTDLDDERLLRIKDHFAKVRPALHPVHVGDHRRGDRDLQEPDPRRDDLQHGEPAPAAGRRRPAPRGAPRGAEGARRGRLPAAGDAVQPDRRHPGRVQRADGPLQGADRGVRRPDARLLRLHPGRARPRDRRGLAGPDRQGAHRRPARRPDPARVGPAGLRGHARSRAATARTRTS